MNRFEEIFATGKKFSTFIQEGLEHEKKSSVGFAKQARKIGTFTASTLERLERIEGRYYLLIAAEVWCPDCHVNLAVMDFLCEAQPNIELAIVSKGRAENDLQHLLGLTQVLVPVVAILDGSFNLIGTFIERPKVVVDDKTGQAMSRYSAGHHMDDTLQDLLDVLEEGERARVLRVG